MDKKVKAYLEARNEEKKNYGYETYALDQYGTWAIRGESPNCDYAGIHPEPLLETVNGRYIDVIQYAVKLDNFYQWGSGGSIKKVRDKNAKEVIEGGYNLDKIKEQYIKKKEKFNGLKGELGGLEKILKLRMSKIEIEQLVRGDKQ
jgi:hypothetical protein